jgi:hypothetical protein
MFDLYNAAERMQAAKSLPLAHYKGLPLPAHAKFIAAARSGALGWVTQQLSLPNGGAFSCIAKLNLIFQHTQETN